MEFKLGRWKTISTPSTTNGLDEAILRESDNHPVAWAYLKEIAHLIAKAPEMYELLKELTKGAWIRSEEKTKQVEELLNQIDKGE